MGPWQGIHWLMATLRAQVVEQSSNSAATHTCDAQEMQGCEAVERKAHSMVIEGDWISLNREESSKIH